MAGLAGAIFMPARQLIIHDIVGNWGFAMGAVVVVLAYLVAVRFSHSAVTCSSPSRMR